MPGEFERLLELSPDRTAVVSEFVVRIFADRPVTRDELVSSMVQGNFPWFTVDEAERREAG